jgi:hypothetical protein
MAEQDDSKGRKPNLPWYYVTRLLGSVLIVYGVFGDHTAERSTIILTGAGLLGIDKVARSDSSKK